MKEEVIFFTEHLSLMLKGGVPIVEVLETLKSGIKSESFRRVLDDISKSILEGKSLYWALGRHSKIFDQFYISIIRISEESGSLEENLKYLSQKLRRDNEMKKKVKGALIYPAIIVFLALVITFTTTLFILPKITNLFQFLEIDLPLATKILISATVFFQKYWLFILVGIIASFVILGFLRRLKLFKLYFDKISLFLPLFGPIMKNFNLLFLSRTLFTLLKSGVPLIQALRICAETVPNETYKRNLLSVKLTVERGEKISSGLEKFSKIFPPVFFQMVLVGERSGTLEESLLYLAEYYEEETDATLKNLSNILEPALLILVGIFVAFVAIAVIVPIYKFTGQLRFRQ
ncbi:MAG: type IV pilus assembly protein PilC [Parcubacteria group bacterium Gr01-1014_30]|nr:MAG: type IV pilus assembly protein PilC [Parcubacteria group bacterium Gr01-1014_30]